MGKTMRGRLVIAGMFSLALAAVGCGDDGPDIGQFAGTWKYTFSSVHLTCTDGNDQTGSFAAPKRWGRGVKSDLVDLSTPCDYLFDVKDKMAVVQQPQTCKFDDGSGTGAQNSEVPNLWVFTLLSALTAEETFETVTTYSDLVMCTLTGTSKFDKVSTD